MGLFLSVCLHLRLESSFTTVLYSRSSVLVKNLQYSQKVFSFDLELKTLFKKKTLNKYQEEPSLQNYFGFCVSLSFPKE